MLRSGLIAAALALAAPALAQPAQFAAAEVRAEVLRGFAILTTLKRRAGVPPDIFHEYVRDVHGPLAARLANRDMRAYWHLELRHDEGCLWPRVDGIDYDLPEAEAFEHSNPTIYASEEALNAYFLDPTIGGILMRDEPNIFSETILYTVPEGQLLEYRAPAPDPIGLAAGEGGLKFLVYVRKSASASTDAFRRFLRERYAPALAANPGVTTLRLFLLEPPDNSNPTNRLATEVSHYAAPDRQYQAAIEVAFTDRLALTRAFGSEAYQATLPEQPRLIRHMHVFTVPETAWMVVDGEMTTVGLRGAPAARLIRRVGAANQLAPDAVRAMTGDARQQAGAPR